MVRPILLESDDYLLLYQHRRKRFQLSGVGCPVPLGLGVVERAVRPQVDGARRLR